MLASAAFSAQYDELSVLSANRQIRLRQQALNDSVSQVSDEFRQVRRPFDPDNGIEGTGMSSPTPDRTFEHPSRPLSDERALAKQVSAALVVDFSHYRSTHKVIAKHAGASPETVKRWMAADSAPSLIYVMRLLPHSPSLRKLVAMDAELSPDFQRELAALIQRHMK